MIFSNEDIPEAFKQNQRKQDNDIRVDMRLHSKVFYKGTEWEYIEDIGNGKALLRSPDKYIDDVIAPVLHLSPLR